MELALWRDIAVVWLAFLCFIGMVIPLAVSLFAVKGMHAAVDRTPRLMRQLQGYSRALRNQVNTASQRVAEPVIQTRKQSTRLSTLITRIMPNPASTSTASTPTAAIPPASTARGDKGK